MSENRRGFLGQLLAGATAIAVPAAAAGSQLVPVVLPDPVTGYMGSRLMTLTETAAALLEYYRYAKPPLWAPAVSIPFAALPINVYVRAKPEEGDVRLVAPITEQLCRGDGATAKELTCEVFNQFFYNKLPDEARIDRLARDSGYMPDRIMSPRFIIDEAELTNTKVAKMLLGCSVAIAEELVRKISDTRKQLGAIEAQAPIQYFKVAPLKVVVKYDAPMLEMYAYTEAAGRFKLNATVNPRLEGIEHLLSP